MRHPRLTGAEGQSTRARGVKGKVWGKIRAWAFSAVIGLIAAICMQPLTSSAAPKAPEPAASAAPVAAKPVAAASPELTAKVKDLLVQLAKAEGAARKGVLESLARTGDQRLELTLADFGEGSLYLWKETVVTCKTLEAEGDKKFGTLSDPLTHAPILADGKPVRVSSEELKEVAITRRDRGYLRDALSLLRLSNPDREARLAAITKSGEGAVEANLPALQEMAKSETDKTVLNAIHESIALIQLSKEGDDAKADRLDAARRLGDMRSARALAIIKTMRSKESDSGAIKLLDVSINRIQHWQTVVEWIGNVFSGLSLSSILILMALGLAIIFGLMGVINMAHGELMMIGAYATYLTQQLFVAYFPNAFNWFFVVAIPLAFLASALVGMLIEGTIIRFLYGRPLDTLLATLGVSYILQQVIRLNFGNNIAVNSPTWLQGSFEIVQDVRLPFNRMFILIFCVLCIGLMYFIIDKTKLGLLLRATTQNRVMAASLGVSTRKIDMLTFGLGSGLAGMAGCALTQIGGVTPDMGQNYVVDSFLVVVVGGVGKLAGAIWSGLGLGMSTKFFEPLTGAVWAKIIILVLVISFIQRRPSGLFPAKGRLADV